MDNIKGWQDHEYTIPEENLEAMDMEKPRRNNGRMKLTDKPNMITYVRVINRINIGSDHRMLMSNIRLDMKAERKKLLRKKPHQKSTLEKLDLKV